MHEIVDSHLKRLPETPPLSSPASQRLYILAEKYRSSSSVKEKVEHGRTLNRILRDPIPFDHDLRESGLTEQVLQTAIETRFVETKGSSNAALAHGALFTLAKVVNRLDLLADGFSFAEELLKNLEPIAHQIIELAAQPQTGFPDIHGPLLEIMLALLSNSNTSTVSASFATSTIHKFLLQAFLTPFPDNSLSNSRWRAYRLLAHPISGTSVKVSGQAPQTILEKFEAETKRFLTQYPTDYIVKQMTESVKGSQDETSLPDFYYIVRRFLLIGQGLQANLLRHGRLHIPMANAWWRVGQFATLQIRPDAASAAFSWDPWALKTVYELISLIEPTDIQQQVFRELVLEADLVLLFGRVLATRKHNLSPQLGYWYTTRWQHSVIEDLAILGQGNRDLIEGRVQRDWLYVGERLAAVARSYPITPDSATSLIQERYRVIPEGQSRKWDVLDLWSLYADRLLGFESGEALDKDTESRRDAFGGDLGCHWVRCPCYGGDMIEFGINVFRCTGCRKAFYCSIACQRLHWKQGVHRSTCRTEDTLTGAAQLQGDDRNALVPRWP